MCVIWLLITTAGVILLSNQRSSNIDRWQKQQSRAIQAQTGLKLIPSSVSQLPGLQSGKSIVVYASDGHNGGMVLYHRNIDPCHWRKMVEQPRHWQVRSAQRRRGETPDGVFQISWNRHKNTPYLEIRTGYFCRIQLWFVPSPGGIYGLFVSGEGF